MGLMRKLDSDVSVFLQQKNKFENMFVFILIYSCWCVCVCFFKSTLAEGNKGSFCSWENWVFFDMCNFGIKRFVDSNGTRLQYSHLENPMDREPGGLQSMGSLRVGHD